MTALHLVIFLLFAQASPPTWLQQATSNVSAIHVELVSASNKDSTESQTKVTAITPPKLDNKQVTDKKISNKTNTVQAEKKSAGVTDNNQTKKEINTADKTKKQKVSKKKSPNTEKDKVLDKATVQNIQNSENKNSKKKGEKQTKSQNKSINDLNKNQQTQVNNHQLVDIDEKHENEGENEDNVDTAGFQRMYRNQSHQKTMNYNEKNIDKNVANVPVFADMLYVSEKKAEQHLIKKPSLPQLPVEISNDKQHPWQVVVTLYVDKHGKVLKRPEPFIKQLQSSGNWLVDEYTLQYVNSLRFKPFKKNNKLVVAEVELLIKY